MVELRSIVKSAIEIVCISGCTIMLIVAVMSLLLIVPLLTTRPIIDDELASVVTGQSAIERIQSEKSGYVPNLASDVFYWDEGFLSDHTTYWSFTCATLSECKLAAWPVQSSFHREPVLTAEDFQEWSVPEFDFILKGPGHFGKQHSSDKWDVTRIRRGTSAIRIDYDSGDSELQFSAIDYDMLRVFRLRWYGSSLTHALDDVGYGHENENARTDKHRRR